MERQFPKLSRSLLVATPSALRAWVNQLSLEQNSPQRLRSSETYLLGLFLQTIVFRTILGYCPLPINLWKSFLGVLEPISMVSSATRQARARDSPFLIASGSLSRIRGSLAISLRGKPRMEIPDFALWVLSRYTPLIAWRTLRSWKRNRMIHRWRNGRKPTWTGRRVWWWLTVWQFRTGSGVTIFGKARTMQSFLSRRMT